VEEQRRRHRARADGEPVKSALRIPGYVAWFFASFIVGIYLTFPLDEMKGLIVDRLEDQLGKGKQGQYGVDPKVTLGSLSLSGFGVKAERVQVQLASREPEPGPTVDIDMVKVGVRPWTLLGKARTVSMAADLYDGSVDAVLSVDEKGAVHDADIEVDDVDLSKIPLVQQKLGIPIAGKVNLDANLDLGATPEKDGTGEIKIDVKGLSVGPGNLKLAAAFGGFEVPTIDLGTLSGEIPVKQGKGTLTGVKLDGKDLGLELGGDIFVKGNLGMSRLDIDGWFAPSPAFLEREKKFKSLLELGESLGGGMSLSKAKDDEGHYWFSLKGQLQNPSGMLARDAGKRAKAKAARANAAPAPKEPKDPKEPKEPAAKEPDAAPQAKPESEG
jgi:type II secretion system protein N